jgi:hypothetical protein
MTNNEWLESSQTIRLKGQMIQAIEQAGSELLHSATTDTYMLGYLRAIAQVARNVLDLISEIKEEVAK